MKVARRIFLVICGLIMTVLGVFVGLCTINQSINNYWMDMLAWALGYFPVGIGIGGGLLLLGILSVIIGLYVKKVVPFAKVSMGDFGNVDISLGAVDNVVKKVAAGIDGIKDIKTRIKMENNMVSVLLDVVMLPDCNIPDTVALLQQDVKTQLETAVGLNVSSVKTAITNIIASK